jgi:hypothetical protein
MLPLKIIMQAKHKVQISNPEWFCRTCDYLNHFLRIFKEEHTLSADPVTTSSSRANFKVVIYKLEIVTINLRVYK